MHDECDSPAIFLMTQPRPSMSKGLVVVYGLGAPSKFSPSVVGRGVGGLFAREAAEDGYQVRAVARDPNKYQEAFKDCPGVELVKGDVTDASSMAGVMGGGVLACLFAAQAPDTHSAYAVDRDALVLLAKVCEKVGAKLLVVSSVLVSKKNRFNPIRIALNTVVKWGMMDAKFEGEEFVRTKVRVRHTIVRPGGLTDAPSSGYALTYNQGDSNWFGRINISKADVAKLLLAALKDPTSDYVTFEVMGHKTKEPLSFEGVFAKLNKDERVPATVPPPAGQSEPIR